MEGRWPALTQYVAPAIKEQGQILGTSSGWLQHLTPAPQSSNKEPPSTVLLFLSLFTTGVNFGDSHLEPTPDPR
jgi:hypothetical protein